MYMSQDFPWFQASTGGLTKYPSQISGGGGNHCTHTQAIIKIIHISRGIIPTSLVTGVWGNRKLSYIQKLGSLRERGGI